MLLAMAMMPMGAWAADAPAAAKSWDFTTALATGDGSDVANLTADATNWTNESSGTSFKNNGAVSNTELTANGNTLAKTAGLKFTLTGSNRVRLYSAESKQLELLAADQSITIDNLTIGQIVYIVSNTGNDSKPERYLEATSGLEVKAGFCANTTYAGRVWNIAKVTSTSITITSKAGLIRIYSIAVYDASKSLSEIDESNGVTNTKENVYVDRTFSKGVWNTLCLPFDLTANQVKYIFGAGTTWATYTGASENTLTFTSSSATISKDVPVLIKPELDVNGLFFSNASLNKAAGTVVNGDYTLTGIFAKTQLTTDDIYVASGNQLKAGNGTNSLKAFRAYFKHTGSGALAPSLMLDIDGMTTAISEIRGLDIITDGPVYNMNGQQVAGSKEGLRKGLYIVNGKKYIVK